MPGPELQEPRAGHCRGVRDSRAASAAAVSLTHSVELPCPAPSPLSAVNCLLALPRSPLLSLSILTQQGREGPGGDCGWC